MSNSTLINELQEKAISHLEEFYLEVQSLKGTGDEEMSNKYSNHFDGLILGWNAIGLNVEYIVRSAMEITKN